MISGAASRILDRAAFALLLAIAVLAPLPFGSNGPESAWILAIASGLVLFFAAGATMLAPDARPLHATPRLLVALGSFAAFALWAVIQLLPYVPSDLAHPLWGESSQILGEMVDRTISIDPELTWAALAKSGGYLAIGTSCFLLVRTPSRRRRTLFTLIAAGLLYAVYGVVELASGDCCVAWEKKIAYFGVATGPFVNRNSFATYLGLSVLVAFGLLLHAFGELRRISAPSALRRIVVLLKLVLASQWMTAIGLLAMVIALLCTSSRAGITSTILGGFVLLLLALRAEVVGSRQTRFAYLASFGAIVVVVLTLFGGGVVGRITNEGIEETDRTQSWQIIVSGIEASPLLGHGFGTFPESFPLYRDDRLASRRFWDKAQDTYLELMLDAGIPATIILLGGFASMLAQCWKGLSRRRRDRRIFPAIGIAATVLVSAHSIYDFSMQIPAIATIYAVILGVALAECGVRREPSLDLG